VLCLDIH